MLRIIMVLAALVSSYIVQSQVAGNMIYERLLRNKQVNEGHYRNHSIKLKGQPSSDLYITARGLANVKADSYMAVFSVTQVGKTAKEVNDLMDLRILQATESLQTTQGIETYIDMLSFVPMYEIAIENKMFSKKTYNEVPAGFELKKNIHIKYNNPALLNDIIASLARAEVYDLVKVDYFSTKIDSIKQELMLKAGKTLQKKIDHYESILTLSFNTFEKHMLDGYKVVFPIDMYRSYTAFSNASLNLKGQAPVNKVQKKSTAYYQPIVAKDFDFVINPSIMEPVIQVQYEIVLRVILVKKEEPKPIEPAKEYILLTPDGEVRKLDL